MRGWSGIDVACGLALGICGLGVALRIGRLAGRRRDVWPEAAIHVVDALPPRPWSRAAWEVLSLPARRFHRQSQPGWTLGCLCYHAAILMVVGGYGAAAAVLAWKLGSGAAIPDFASHVDGGGSRSPSNLLALVFGNAEAFPSAFLFGRWAGVFRTFAACELPLALIGNLLLLRAAVCAGSGAVLHPMDPAAGDVRIRGAFSGQRLLVRILILAIIATELVGRQGWLPGIVHLHVLLGMCLLAMVPFTYLAHVALAPLALWQAISRRRRNALA